MGVQVPTIELTLAESMPQILVKRYPVSIGLPACDIDDWSTSTGDSFDCVKDNDEYIFLCGDRTYTKKPYRVMFKPDAFNLPVFCNVDYIRITAIVKNFHHWDWCDDGNNGNIHTLDGYTTILASTDDCGSIESSPSVLLAYPNLKQVPTSYYETESGAYAITYTLTQNPSTATDWTFTDVENLTFGLEGAANCSMGYKEKVLYWDADYLIGNYEMQYPTLSPPIYPYMTDDSSSGLPDTDTYCAFVGNNLSSPSLLFTVDTSSQDFIDYNNRCDNKYIGITLSAITCRMGSGNPVKFKLAVRHNGTYYYSSEFTRTLGHPNWIKSEWAMTTRPWDSQPWEQGDFNPVDTQFGVVVTYQETQYAYMGVADCRITASTEFAYTEVRCLEMYASAVYHESSPAPCKLPKPVDIQVDHQIDTSGLNFWSGNREVYAIGRSSKRTTLSGLMWDGCTDGVSTCEDIIDCVRELGKRQQAITVSGMRYGILNCKYNIISFSWVQIKEKPNTYEWSLELEFKKDVCV